jgi:hypothetical protein
VVFHCPGLSGPILERLNGAWPAPGGGTAGAYAPGPVFVDNSESEHPVLAKREKCAGGFRAVQAGERWYEAVDGVKPWGWRAGGSPEYSEDWYKVADGVSVRINADGTPTRFGSDWSMSLKLWTAPYYEVNYDDWYAGYPGWEWAYGHFGGRKKEPDWSVAHWDWLYPDPLTPAQRASKCGPGK